MAVLRSAWWLVVGATLWGGSTGHAAEKWLYAQTPHFEMYSATSARESEELLSSLELFRLLFLETLGQPVERNPPTTIVVFNRDRDFDAYKPIVNGKVASLAGVCLNNPDGTFIALSAERDTDRMLQTIYHEYVHQLVGAMGMKAPPWLNEGWAEVFETFFRQKGALTLGKAHEDHVLWLRRQGVMPLVAMMGVTHGSPDYTESNRQGRFYASSWLMVHYFLFGQSDLPRDGLGRFLALSDQSPHMPVEELVQACFGHSAEEMDRRLRRYLIDGRYMTATTKPPATWPGKDVAFAAAEPFARDLALLQVKARIQRDPAAAYAVRQLQAQRPDDPRPYELLGAIARRDGDSGLARDHWAQAAACGSNNGFIYLSLVERELGQWLRGATLRQTIPDDVAQRWRTMLGQALAIDPADQRVIYWLAWLEACAERASGANVGRLQQAAATQRKRVELFLGLAVIRWRMGDVGTARTIIQAIANATVDRGARLQKDLAKELGVELGDVATAPIKSEPVEVD